MTRPGDCYQQRLAAGRALLAALKAGGPGLPNHVLDQIAAATNDAHGISHRLAATLRLVEPGRAWQDSCSDGAIPDELDVRILVALAECRSVCPHLRHGGPQPVWARLAHHRLDCARCIHTIRRPPAGEDDRCDWCGATEISVFTPLGFQRGPLLILGDACETCAATLRTAAA